jgi:exosome complex component RRP46
MLIDEIYLISFCDAVAIGCGVLEDGEVILDTNKAEEQQLKSFAHLVFPNSRKSASSKEPNQKEEDSERGLITSITHGVMSGMVISCASA